MVDHNEQSTLQVEEYAKEKRSRNLSREAETLLVILSITTDISYAACRSVGSRSKYLLNMREKSLFKMKQHR